MWPQDTIVASKGGSMDAMPLLHLSLVLLLCLPSPSASNILDPQVLQANSDSCRSMDIPYPFVPVSDTSGEPAAGLGLEVLCSNSSSHPMLSLGNHNYQILNISLLEGYIRIAGRSIAWNCYNISGEDIPPDHAFRLEGTPYTFSYTRNKFVAIGCDAMVLIHGGSGDGTRKYTSGCVSFCAPDAMDSIIDGSCSGVGCCQASIPRGLKSFSMNFSSIRSLTGSNGRDGLINCSRAFIIDQEWFHFNNSDLAGLPGDEFRPVVLDWAIGSDTCEEAQMKNETSAYACKENSYCYDSTNGGGYRCNCNDGFTGNPYLGCKDINECSDPAKSPCVHKCINTIGSFRCTCPPGSSGNGRKDGTGCKRITPLEIFLGAGLGLLVIFLMGSSWAYWGLKKRKISKLKERHFFQNGGLILQQHISSREATARIFTSEELERATDNFSESRVLGRGGYGTVYKGILLNQRVVAIKKSKVVDKSQIDQFINEVVILSQINHKNVVKLLGCCLETQVPLLVYEFISNGTLFHHVHDSKSAPPMPWEHRLRIAVETAGALGYLHSVASIPIIHRDVKSANILLDENYTAKVSDFGASRLVPCNQTHITTLVQGTLGYLDPEYFHTSQLTDKSDVYSFGVVLVEILTREKPISMGRSETERNLASHFVSLVEENRFLEMIDPQTVKEAGVRHLYEIALLARRCLSVKGEERPTMKEVVVELDALRRLLSQHLVRQSQGKEFSFPQNPSNLLSSDEIRPYSMESHLLMSMDLP